MHSIRENIVHKEIIKKSVFISKLYSIDKEETAKDILSNTRNEYRDADHICYGYIIESTEKCSDNGEPSGTAGIPILHILKQNDLNHVLCIVIRYFGGIKLGAGGLIRAYASGVKSAISKANIISLVDGIEIMLTFPYTVSKQMEYLLSSVTVIDKCFVEKISCHILIEKKEWEKIKEKIEELSSIRIIKMTKIGL